MRTWKLIGESQKLAAGDVVGGIKCDPEFIHLARLTYIGRISSKDAAQNNGVLVVGLRIGKTLETIKAQWVDEGRIPKNKVLRAWTCVAGRMTHAMNPHFSRPLPLP